MDTEKHLQDLALRAERYGIYTESKFLTEGERAAAQRLPLAKKPQFFGGFPEAERCIAVFGDEEELGYPYESPIRLLCIAPKMQKYADALTHRDVLGALMHLGLERDVLGDLILHENIAYQFVLEGMAPFICAELSRVRHTAVTVRLVEALPEGVGPVLEEDSVVCASPRLDAVVGAVFHLSRSEAKELVEAEKVSIFGQTELSPTRSLKEGERVSVRGFGRFYYDGETGNTRSGKSRVRIRRFV